MPGVRKATVSFDNKDARVEFDPKKTDVKKMVAALKKVDYVGSVKSWPKS